MTITHEKYSHCSMVLGRIQNTINFSGNGYCIVPVYDIMIRNQCADRGCNTNSAPRSNRLIVTGFWRPDVGASVWSWLSLLVGRSELQNWTGKPGGEYHTSFYNIPGYLLTWTVSIAYIRRSKFADQSRLCVHVTQPLFCIFWILS